MRKNELREKLIKCLRLMTAYWTSNTPPSSLEVMRECEDDPELQHALKEFANGGDPLTILR